MPIIGRQCTRDLKTVCQRMSEASLPVNQGGPGLTLVYGWQNEDRRAQSIPASVQGIELVTTTGKHIALEYCPWCASGIVSSSANVVRTGGTPAPAPAPEPRRAMQPQAEDARSRAKEPARRDVEDAAPVRMMHVQGDAAVASAALKTLREKLGISQAELGEKLGLARSTIANYENGRAPLSERLKKWMEKHEKRLASK